MQVQLELRRQIETDDETALEMALLLQDETLAEPDLIRGLAARFGRSLWLFIALLLIVADGANPEPDAVTGLLLQVLKRAAHERSSVWGTDEIRGWLLRLAVDTVLPQGTLARKRRQLGRITRLLPRRHNRNISKKIPPNMARPHADISQRSRGRSETGHLVLALSFAWGFGPDEISRLTGISPKAIRAKLAGARQDMLQASGIPFKRKTDPPQNHGDVRRHLLENIQDQPSRADSSEPGKSHLQTCESCQAFQQALVELDCRMRSAWAAAAEELAAPGDLDEQIEPFLELNVETDNAAQPLQQLRFKEAAWTILVLALAGAAAWRFNLGTPPGGGPLIAPTAIAIPDGPYPNLPESQAGASRRQERYPPFSGAPALSADGRFLAFTASVDDLVPKDENERPDVFVYDRDFGSIELVSVTSNGSQADDWSDWPSISADGRFVTFASPAANMAAGNIQTCSRPGWPRWELAGNCVNIYLRDLANQETTLVTSGLKGQRVFGSSLSPAISADGNWIAFWSYANNLVEGDTELCGAVNCMDLFLYDRLEAKTKRIPVGRDPNLAVGNEQLSISGDGRYTVFHVLPSDRVASGAGDSPAAEVWVYDRDRDVAETLIAASGSHPAERAAVAPQISADGQMVAFASRSTSLSPLDTENNVDVYVFNRSRGTIDLASLPGGSRYRLGDSGVSPYPPGLWGERISISTDGRFVAFSSQIIDTRPDAALGNSRSREGKYIIVRDRLAGVSRTVVRGLPLGLLYEYPSLSADGRWLAFTARAPLCIQACASTVLLDRAMGIMKWLGPSAEELAQVRPTSPNVPTEQWQYVKPLDGLDGAVRGLAFSPQGRLLATGGDDRIVRLWQPNESPEPQILGEHEDIIRAIGFSPDGEYLASGSQDGIVQIWHIPTGRLLDVLSVRPNAVRSLAFSRQGFLAVGSLRQVDIWRIDSNLFVEFDRLTYPGEFVDALAYSPGGDYLAVAPGDHTVWIRDTSSGRIAARLGGHEKIIKAVAFSSDGSLLASGANDTRVNVWALNRDTSDELSVNLRASFYQSQWVTGLAFVPKTDRLAVSTLDGSLSLWEIDGQRFVQSALPRIRAPVLAVALSADAGLLAVSTTADVRILENVRTSVGANEPTRYFTRLEADHFQSIQPMLTAGPLFPPETESPMPTEGMVKSIQARAPFDLRVPLQIRPGFELVRIHWPLAGDENMAMLIYHRSSAEIGFEQMLFIQGLAEHWQSDVGGIFSLGIGASAVIERVNIEGDTAEFVRGTWTPQGGGFLELVFPAFYENIGWDLNAIAGQLRWQWGDVRYGLLYRTTGVEEPGAALDIEDLIGITAELSRQE